MLPYWLSLIFRSSMTWFFSTWLVFSSLFHDIRLAKFRITEVGSGYELSINFDRSDLLESIYASRDYENDVLLQAEAYVKENLHYLFDGDTVLYDLEEIEYTENNIVIKGKILADKLSVTEINVVNTCLVDEVKGHMNIMEFFLNDKERFFRLDQARTKTIVKY